MSVQKITMSCLTLALSAGLSGCSGLGSGSSGSSALSLSGTLSLAATSSSLSVMGSSKALYNLGKISDDYVSVLTIDITTYTVKCVTTTPPIETGSGSIASDGKFTVSISGAKNQPIACYLVDAGGTRQADFIISDASHTDLNGQNQVSGTASYTKDASLGTVSFDPNSGEVTVPKANISAALASEVASTTTVFDPSGVWTIGVLDFSLPAGVNGPCTGQNCKGPPDGQALYLKMWQGLKTSDSSKVFGLQLWESAAKASTCGGKVGLTSAIKSSIGVDFSANGAADSPFVFASSVSSFHDQVSGTTGTVNLTNNWKMNTATTQWNITPNCGPRDISIGSVNYTNAWMCGPDSGAKYQAQLGGGCQDSSGNPVNLENWGAITCGAMTVSSEGIREVNCSGTATINSTPTAVTCKNKWAVTDSSFSVLTSSGVNFDWSSMTQIPTGTPCSSISTATNSSQIAQLQCYAAYYDRSGMRQESSACLPQIDMDWSASSAANFVKVDDIRPSGLIFFEQFMPLSDGTGGSMVTRQEHFDGVHVNGDSWVNCRIVETGALSIKKISATKMLATYQESTVTTSTSKPACLAHFTGERKTFMFYLNK